MEGEYVNTGMMLEELPNKLCHEIMVPLLGSETILVPGKIVDTKSCVMQMGDKVFVRRRVDKVSEILGQRRTMTKSLIRDYEKETAHTKRKAATVQELGTDGHPAEEEIVKKTDKGLVRKTPERFLEIN